MVSLECMHGSSLQCTICCNACNTLLCLHDEVEQCLCAVLHRTLLEWQKVPAVRYETQQNSAAPRVLNPLQAQERVFKTPACLIRASCSDDTRLHCFR
jgi:hypothetical protein